jgi:hypothetical protein
VDNVYYYNTSFDAELAGNYTDRIKRLSAEMSVYALLSAASNDTVICDAVPDDSYLKYLRDLGFSAQLQRGSGSGLLGQAWGWSECSLERLESVGCVCDHPPLETVKKVNSRAFSIGIARSLGIPYAGESAHDISSLREIIQRLSYPILIKPLHGSSGMGHFVLDNPESADDICVKLLTANPSGVSAEPLLDRVDDFAVNFMIDRDGSVSECSFHQCVTDNRGIFRGIKIREDDDCIETWRERIMKSVHASASALHDSGFFGHAGIDLFTFRTPDGIDIHPLCEINARRTMGEVARACRRTMGGKCGLLRQIPSARCGSHYDLMQTLGDYSYDKSRSEGICIISPETLRYEGSIMRPALVMIYAAAGSERSLDEMEDAIEKSTIRKRLK